MSKMKKQLMILLCALVLALGCSATAFAAENGGLIGYVDTQRVMQSYPDIQITMSAIQMEYQKAQDEFNSKAAGLDDKGRQELNDKLMQQVAKREQELMDPIRKKIRSSIEKVAKDQGIESVVDIEAMLAGGKDLTNDVIAQVQK